MRCPRSGIRQPKKLPPSCGGKTSKRREKCVTRALSVPRRTVLCAGTGRPEWVVGEMDDSSDAAAPTKSLSALQRLCAPGASGSPSSWCASAQSARMSARAFLRTAPVTHELEPFLVGEWRTTTVTGFPSSS